MQQNLQFTLIGSFLLSISLLLVITHQADAQADPIKFGKVEQKELEMKVYNKDTSASAIVLCDYGKSYFRFNQNDGFQVYFERHTRIKILKKSGYDQATGQIPVYHASNSNEEEVMNLKGFTYNLEGGNIVKEKLTKEGIFEEALTKNWKLKKFTMPAVKEGSVVEYSYTVKSDFLFNLREWEFQRDIPILWSEYRATIPQYFNYKQLAQGYEEFYISERKPVIENFIPNTGTSNNASQSTAYRWVTKDVPAFKEEPYMTTVKDYISKIEFELASVKFPGEMEKPIANSWETLTEALLKDENFGLHLNKAGFAKDVIAAIQSKHKDPTEQVKALYDHVRNHMKWNDHTTIYVGSNLKKVYESHSGDSGDINLLLTAVLREAGFDANPVILSTRDHGRILPHYALISKFNYVIAHVNIVGKEYLLDATDPFTQLGILPARCLNGTGRLISNVNPRWIPLTSTEKRSTVFTARLTVDKIGDLKGNVDISNGGYSASYMRKTLQSLGKENYIETLKKNKPSWQVAKYDFIDIESLDKAVNTKYEVTISDHAQVAGNLIYLKPMLTEGETENPFKLADRKFPVDFAAPIDETFICYYTLPEGYLVEELPKNAIIDLPEKAGRFTYMAAVSGNTLQVMSKIQLKKAVFSAEEYQFLKELYSQIVTKHAEQIVLKKSGS